MLFVPAAFAALSQCPFSHQPITAVRSRILVPKGSSLVGRSPCQIIVRNTALSTGLLLCKSCQGCKCRSTLGETPDNSCFCVQPIAVAARFTKNSL